MSEKEQPEKENKKFRDECMNCEINFGLNKHNTFAVVYEKDHEYNHLHVTCPDCSHQYRVFCNSETLDQAMEAGVYFNPKIRIRDDETGEIIEERRVGGMYAPVDIVQMWEEVQGMELVQPVELSPRHEKQLLQFGHTIIAMLEKDPDGFWEDMDSPQDRPYPSKWC